MCRFGQQRREVGGRGKEGEKGEVGEWPPAGPKFLDKKERGDHGGLGKLPFRAPSPLNKILGFELERPGRTGRDIAPASVKG